MPKAIKKSELYIVHVYPYLGLARSGSYRQLYTENIFCVKKSVKAYTTIEVEKIKITRKVIELSFQYSRDSRFLSSFL